MAYLFIDTTSNLKIGLLSEEMKWMSLHNLDEKKPSEIIHKIIHESLLANNLSIKEISKVIACAGPGSYTGMRLSEGIVQVVELAGVPANTFYHFDLPNFLGVKKYFWVATAFKGEYFIFLFDNAVITKKLVKKEDLKLELSKYEDFAAFALAPDENLPAHFRFTTTEIVNNPEKYMKEVIARNTRDHAFYYRSVDEEFKIK